MILLNLNLKCPRGCELDKFTKSALGVLLIDTNVHMISHLFDTDVHMIARGVPRGKAQWSIFMHVFFVFASMLVFMDVIIYSTTSWQ